MILMGLGLVGGAAAAIVPNSLLPLDQEVGTHTSAAGAVLGVGIALAAVNPVRNISWVRAGILYGFVVLAFEAGAYFAVGARFHLGPVIFGLAMSLLLIATYPDRGRLLPASDESGDSAPAPAAPPKPPSTKEPAEAS